ncbi:MAG TPA: hypothetical protein VFX60_13865 [Micromonospora sp.]|nr:hypothetical protein [Micromonospora sp.]
MRASRFPGARGYYDQQRNRGTNHHPPLRQLGNRPAPCDQFQP